jgi:hypothetical protein
MVATSEEPLNTDWIEPSESQEPTETVSLNPVQEGHIIIDGDSIRVFAPTGPTILHHTKIEDQIRNFEPQLTGMKLRARVRVDEVGKAAVIGEVDFLPSSPKSKNLQGMLAQRLENSVRNWVWKAARDDSGEPVARTVILEVILRP